MCPKLMERVILILAFVVCAMRNAQSQSLSIDDLLNLTSISSPQHDNFLLKKGFPIKRRSIIENSMGFIFFQNRGVNVDSSWVERSVNLYKKNDTWCAAFITSSLQEYMDGKSRLKLLNFQFDATSDTGTQAALLFQKKAVTVETLVGREENAGTYTFLITKKEIPAKSGIRYAEDLLKFDSHEFLVSCYGEKSVKKDIYIFSESEKKNCSILFPHTDEQAVFIWEDEANYRKISYVLISGTLSTPEAKEFSGSFSNNKWELKNGIHQGMRISDLLRLNSNDFTFYGNKSEYAMMVEPKVTGSINFKWIGIGFNCFNCDRADILDKPKVRASDAVNNNLAMHISCIMLSP
jgi:hypothetical protein